jgi:hypothetical protein
MVHLGRPDEALDLMKLAQSGSGEEVLPRTRAMFHTIEAWAQASMGKGQAMRRTLGRAEDLFVSDKSDVETPDWMQTFKDEDLYGMTALAYRTLAEFEPGAAVHAQHYAEKALSLRVDGRERSKIFDHLSMASACFIADDPEQADRYARLALMSMGSNSSRRTWDRLRQMYRLTAEYASYPKIQELREEIRLALPKPRGKGGSGAQV